MALNLLANLPMGRYAPGESWLHRLDPRLKLLGLPALVIATFASTSLVRLATLALAGLLLAGCCSAPPRLWLRLVWALRYLFLFTLALHTLLTPGHTLLGMEWLSLDGLQLGFRVCLQLFLALIFSSLLTLTTTPGALAQSFAGLLAPLGWLGVPVERWADNLILVLGLIPVLQQEAAELSSVTGVSPPLPRMALELRLQRAGQLLAALMLRMIGRADALALALVRGEAIIPARTALSPWFRPTPLDLLATLAFVSLLLLYGWLP